MVAAPTPLPALGPVRRSPGADTGTLVQLGLATAPPVPGRPVPRVPRMPQSTSTVPIEPVPAVPVQEHELLLTTALTDVGYIAATADTAAVESIATLDRAVVDQVVRWIRRNQSAAAPKA